MSESLERELFRAARVERPTAEAKRRTLTAVRESSRAMRSRRRMRIAGAVAVLALAAGWAIFATVSETHESEPLSLRAEPTQPTPESVPTVPPSPPASAPSKAQAPVAPRTNVRPAPPTPSAVPKPSLTDEVRALEKARSELRSGDASAALVTLDDYDRRLRGGVMNAEATLLRIEALARAGRVTDADALARRFVEANPHSALADRARQFVKSDTGEKP
jgi:hypothetical protein